jgi:hypothetical protein
MPYVPRVRRLRRRERVRRRRFVAGTIVTIILMAGSLIWLSRTPRVAVATEAEHAPEALVAITTQPVDGAPDASTEAVVYPYSIIPGGAADAAALREAIDADPVVRAHYANFDLSRTHVVRLTAPQVAHVSYRIGDDVFWTKKPLLLKTGETLLTDGQHYARTRCGNQLAASPGAVSADEPPSGAFDSPLQRLAADSWLPTIPPLSPTTGILGPGGEAPGPVFTGGFPFPVGGTPMGDPGGTGSRNTINGAPPSAIASGSSSIDGPVFPPIVVAGIPPGGSPNDPPAGGGDPNPPGLPRIVSNDPPPGGGNTRPVPEPQLLMLIGTGGVAWLGRRMRRKRG